MSKNVEIEWRLEGEYFETCNCEAACPCIWFKPPTDGDCRLLVGWHIKRGRYGATRLDNLNVALACYAPGNMKDGEWQAALYLDERVNEDQWVALEQIFSGQVGGQPALLLGFVTKVLGSQLARIDFRMDGERRRLVIEGVAEAEVEGIQGIRGGVPAIDNPPLCVVSSHPSRVAKSRTYTYQDYGFKWEFSGRNGFYSPFVYGP
ncbi:MAG: DUF1326 domain-containing protein [Methylohalobius sp. ZOD2]|nr:DUF1326 domain-containing protein [Methylothermaceae bacterium]